MRMCKFKKARLYNTYPVAILAAWSMKAFAKQKCKQASRSKQSFVNFARPWHSYVRG